jgi:hypothetical protein
LVHQKEFNMPAKACPRETQDIAANLANRKKAITTAMYGPMNPNEPNEDYWIKLGKEFETSPEEAKKSRCGNCAAFNVTTRIKNCIAQGLGRDRGDEWATIDAGDLGYCEAFDFKCAAKRTCKAWIVGGPLNDQKEDQKKGFVEAVEEQA